MWAREGDGGVFIPSEGDVRFFSLLLDVARDFVKKESWGSLVLLGTLAVLLVRHFKGATWCFDRFLHVHNLSDGVSSFVE